jgi:hypothetical protein
MASGGREPRNFFLNEAHELSPEEKRGGGRIPDYVGIEWGAKGRRLADSMDSVTRRIRASRDPLRDDKYFVVAQPVPELRKRSKAKGKPPEFDEPTNFGGGHGRTFERLGLNLLQVTDDGLAIVHAPAERLGQLAARTRRLDSLGAREQSRWATIDLFETIPLNLRVDADWLKSLGQEATDVVFELQPVLNRVEADRVLRAIADVLAEYDTERLVATGTDFSGRFWFRGKASRNTVRSIARDFFSVQAIHSPLFSNVSATGRAVARRQVRFAAPAPAPDARDLPCVAVVDLGVPSDHVQLAQYCRGRFVPQAASSIAYDDHASFVASRVVFGDWDNSDGLESAAATCSFYDVVVGDGYENRVNDKVVMDALRGVRGAAPDVRVFNLSIGDARPLGAFPDVEQREKRLLLQDLDNFAFANDALIVVAAGNSPAGVSPIHAYPSHFADPRWALGPWAAGLNTLVCGSYVKHVATGALVRVAGWPSGFSRIGPGLCDAPVPSFCAGGGNSTEAYQFQAGFGVWGLSGQGLAEDRAGTSHSAPILAREAALAMDALRHYCPPGTNPFAVTIRAFLALTASATTHDPAVRALAERTLGFGSASHLRLIHPKPGSAILFWQGIIQSPRDIVRVQLPVPSSWLEQASAPILRIAICYDPPVNDSARDTWTCRRVKAVLHTGADEHTVRAPSGAHHSYPLIVREYTKLKPYAPSGDRPAGGDMWLLELQYEEIFDYVPGMIFDPQQRVAFVAELVDGAERPVDPQPAIQGLPAAATMSRLAAVPAQVRSSVLVRSGV